MNSGITVSYEEETMLRRLEQLRFYNHYYCDVLLCLNLSVKNGNLAPILSSSKKVKVPPCRHYFSSSALYLHSVVPKRLIIPTKKNPFLKTLDFFCYRNLFCHRYMRNTRYFFGSVGTFAPRLSILFNQTSTRRQESLVDNHPIIWYATSPKRPKKGLFRRILNKIKHMMQMIIDSILVAWRTSEIIIRFSPLFILTPAAKLFPSDHLSNLAWEYTLYTVQSLGPAYIKVCQWAATRRDLFPQNICDRLSHLHDGASLHSWDHTHHVLSKAFGINYHLKISGEEGGLKIDPKNVIGSGSVAQVYRGTLTYNGEEKQVAVKVLHPNIQQKIERDLKLMERLAQLCHALPSETVRMINLPRVCGNFADIMRHQIDLRNEAKHLQKFRKNFVCDDRISKIAFPMPFLADENCLVEDYEDATPMSSFLMDDTEEGMRVRRKLAGPLLRAFLKMVFMDNFVHSDLHQGNIKVRRSIEQVSSGKHVDKYTIVFLDAGIVTSLNKQDKRNLRDLFKAVITNDGEEAGRLMVERAKYERCSKVDGGVEQFSKGVEDIVSEFHDRRKQGLTLGVVRIGTLLGRVLDLCRVYGVEIDPAMSNIVMSTLVLEGLGRTLDPDANLFDIALPFVLGFGKV
mmetsp:Transcript_10228/g.19159  ORF Transcript_10228/g.19159 Transcript_10228/m.19159 type:complete len:627 (+) Transcript_10228:71-1951(+)